MADESLKCKICGRILSSKLNIKIHYVSVHSQPVMEEPKEDQHRCNMCGKIYTQYDFLSRHRRACHEQNVQYTCDHCGKSFARFFTLAEHIRGHMSEDHLKCKICGKNFSSKWRLKVHSDSVHSQPAMEGPQKDCYKCDKCGKMYTRYHCLIRHLRACSDPKVRFTCDHCGKSFSRLKTLREHILAHMGDERLKCKICKKGFSSMGSLKIHCFSVHSKPVMEKPEEDQHRCDKCGKMYTQYESLRRHVKACLQYTCDHCGRSFSTSYILRDHILCHKGDECLKCKICGKIFSSKWYVKLHYNSVHAQPVMEGSERNRFRCDLCGKIYKQYGSLSQHMKARHKENMQYTCDHCGKSFFGLNILKKHIHGHMCDEHLKCKICKKSFSLMGNLKRHFVSVHSQPIMEGPERNRYKCDLCGKIYTHSHALKLHTRARHEQNRLYTCDHCGKSFVRLKTLREHILGHMDDECLKCKICKKSFSSKGSLKKHCASFHAKPAEKGLKTRAKVKCKQCGEIIKHQDVKYHARIHTSADASNSALDTTGCSPEDSSLKAIDKILAECRIKMEDGQLSTAVKTERLETNHC